MNFKLKILKKSSRDNLLSTKKFDSKFTTFQKDLEQKCIFFSNFQQKFPSHAHELLAPIFAYANTLAQIIMLMRYIIVWLSLLTKVIGSLIFGRSMQCYLCGCAAPHEHQQRVLTKAETSTHALDGARVSPHCFTCRDEQVSMMRRELYIFHYTGEAISDIKIIFRRKKIIGLIMKPTAFIQPCLVLYFTYVSICSEA